MRRAALIVIAACTAVLAACSAGPPTYRIMVTEPSGNLSPALGGQLFVHWSCDRSVDPATRYQGSQDALWTSVDGAKGSAVLETMASCTSGSLLTVQVDGAIAEIGGVKTVLRCEVFNDDGAKVADESVPRVGRLDAICRVPVP